MPVLNSIHRSYCWYSHVRRLPVAVRLINKYEQCTEHSIYKFMRWHTLELVKKETGRLCFKSLLLNTCRVATDKFITKFVG
jgi:hypothetical protein